MLKGELVELAKSQGWNASASTAEAMTGGYTAAEKYVVHAQTGQGESYDYFVKSVPSDSPIDLLVMETEAAHYRMLTELGLTGRYFPHFHDFVKMTSKACLVIDYLPDTEFGGPWTAQNIDRLHEAFEAVHSISLSEDQADMVKRNNKTLTDYLEANDEASMTEERRAELFDQAWQQSRVTNSRGQAYYQAQPQVYEEVKEAVAGWDPEAGNNLILVDVNSGNIGFNDQSAVFVDPVYMKLGNKKSDLTGAGINILQLLPEHETELRQQVLQKYLNERAALAWHVAHLVATTQLDYGEGDNPWMDAHQDWAITSLKAWEELYGTSL